MPDRRVFVASLLDYLPQPELWLEAVQSACAPFRAELLYTRWPPPPIGTPGAYTFDENDEALVTHFLDVQRDVVRRADLVLFPVADVAGPPVGKTGLCLAHHQLDFARAASRTVQMLPLDLSVAAGASLMEQEAFSSLVEALNHYGLSRKPLRSTRRPVHLHGICAAALHHYYYPNIANDLKVMISSTFQDLKDLRADIIDHLRGLGVYVRPMEDIRVPVPDPYTQSMQMVDETNVYLGIVATRYGEKVSGQADLSLTHLEYERAKLRGHQMLVFVPDKGCVLPAVANPTPREDLPKLHALREQMGAEPFSEKVTSLDELVGKVINGVLRLRLPRSSAAAYTMDIPNLPHPYIAHQYTLLDNDPLIGRDREMEALDGWLRDRRSPYAGKRVLVVEAAGGVGKSALTWTWTHGDRVRGAFTGMVWWSFYHHAASFEDFAVHVLAYLHEKSVRAIRAEFPGWSALADGLIGKLYEMPVLLVLDGLERQLELFMRSEHLRYEYQNLDVLIAERQEAYRRAFAGRTGDPEVEREARRYYRRLDPHGKDFFQRLLAEPHLLSRVLVTSRLLPAELEQEDADRLHPLVERLELSPLDLTSTQVLWERHGLEWEEKSEAITARCGRHPLYTLLFARSVQSNPDPGERRADRWAVQHLGGRNVGEMTAEEARVVLVLAGREGLLEDRKMLLAYLAAGPYAVPFADLVQEFVEGRDLFATEGDLYLALSDLRRRKLIGLEPCSVSYDLHPIIRHHININDPDVRRYVLRLGEPTRVGGVDAADKPDETLLWAAQWAIVEHSQARLFAGPDFGRWLHRVSIRLEQGDIAGAFDIFLAGYDVLRFRSLLFRQLRDQLETFAARAEAGSGENRGGDAERNLTGDRAVRLYAYLADIRHLTGATTAEALEAANLSVTAAFDPETGEPQEDNTVAAARVLLRRAPILSAQGRYYAAERDARNGLRLLNGAPRASDGEADDLRRWLWCSVSEGCCARGEREAAGRAWLVALSIGGADDADVLDLSFSLAVYDDDIIRARRTAERMLRVSHDRLGLGVVSSRVHLANADLLAGNLEAARQTVPDALRAAIDNSLQIYFVRMLLASARLLWQEATAALPLESQARAGEALRQAEEAAREAARLGLNEDLAEVLVLKARLLRARAGEGDAETARFSLQEAHQLACGADGRPYAPVRLLKEISELLDATGERLEGTPGGGPLRQNFTAPRRTEEGAGRWRAMDAGEVAAAAPPAFGARDPREFPPLGLLMVYPYSESNRLPLPDGLPEVPPPPALPAGASPDPTIEDAWRAAAGARLGAIRERCDWENTTGSARKWWEEFEKENSHRLALVIRLAEELLRRRATVTEFFLANVYSNADNIQANLCYLDYTGLKKAEERHKKAQAAGQKEAGEPDSLPASVQADEAGLHDSTTTWAEAVLRHHRAATGELLPYLSRLDGDEPGTEAVTEEVLHRVCCLDAATGSAQKWWAQFEKKAPADVRVALLSELGARRATVTEYFLAYIYSNTDNIQANLYYLDYTRLKKAEERRRKEEARRQTVGEHLSGSQSEGAQPPVPPPSSHEPMADDKKPEEFLFDDDDFLLGEEELDEFLFEDAGGDENNGSDGAGISGRP